MTGPERPADRIVRLMREANIDAAPAPAHGIVLNGDGNVHLGDVVTINHAGGWLPRGRADRRADRRTLRASAINYIRGACRRTGDPLAWAAFARTEFGLADLDALTDLQLERIRGWCAAQEERRA